MEQGREVSEWPVATGTNSLELGGLKPHRSIPRSQGVGSRTQASRSSAKVSQGRFPLEALGGQGGSAFLPPFSFQRLRAPPSVLRAAAPSPSLTLPLLP